MIAKKERECYDADSSEASMDLGKGFASKATEIFEDKAMLWKLVYEALLPQFEWERNKWEVFVRYIPLPETKDEETRRKQAGNPRLFFKVTPHRTSDAHRNGCVSKKFRNTQIANAGRIVFSAKTLKKLIERLKKNVEVL